jgi:hypothetical protein
MKLSISLILKSFLLTSLCATTADAAVPIQIKAYGIHFGGQVVYRYQVQNNSASTIYQVELGLQTEMNGPEELPGLPWSNNPTYFNADAAVMLPLNECKPFVGMDCFMSVIQFESMIKPRAVIHMSGAESSPQYIMGMEDIKAGTVSSVAELYVPAAHQSTGYLTATGRVSLLDNLPKNLDGSFITSVDVPFTKLDTTPPVLSVTLNPATITSAQRGQMIPVTATITVKDDYDPAPEIKLEYVKVLGAANPTVGGAVIGTDSRRFQISVPAANPSNTLSWYAFLFSATDASGNKVQLPVMLRLP